MSLPRFMVIKSNECGKYLRYGKGKDSTLSSLNFSHEMKHPNLNVADHSVELLKTKKDELEETPMEFHLLKFEVQEAKDIPGYVHIRTSYNNKYLVRKSKESKSLVAEAHEVEEDQSKWSCTLFKPIFLGEADDEEEGGCLLGNKHGIGMTPQKIQLVHTMSQEYVYMDTVTESMELTCAANSTPTTLTIFDVEPTAILPVYLAFRGHNGKYVGSPDGASLWFLYSDIGTPGVPMINTSTSKVPTWITLKTQDYNEHYWMVNNNNGMYVTRNGLVGIDPIKVNNYIVLYVGSVNKFISLNKGDNGAVARSTTIIDDAKLEVVEAVLSRSILSITYDLKNARVYGTTDVTKINDSRSNYTDQRETGSLSKDFTMSKTMTWNHSFTVSVGMSMTMSFGVPLVGVGGEISLNFDISETCEWGEQKTSSETITHIYDFDIPPRTKQIKTVVASRSSCDVPFTCEVEDVMTNGSKRKYTKTDCWFTGANDYNANQETHNVPLPP